MKPFHTEKWQRKPSDSKKASFFSPHSQSLILWRAVEHTWGLAACSMIFSSKVWSCSLTESLESPSLSSKLGSTKERKQKHSNPSGKNCDSGRAPLLFHPKPNGGTSPAALQQSLKTTKSLTSALLRRKPALSSAASAGAGRVMVTLTQRPPHLCQSGPWSDLASGTQAQRWCQSPGEPPASPEQAMS